MKRARLRLSCASDKDAVRIQHLIPGSSGEYGRRMRATPRLMLLTPELVARLHRPAQDYDAGMLGAPPSDTDHDDAVREIVAAAPARDDAWVFAYGSLIWNPAFEFIEQRMGVTRGWHRSFCLGPDRWLRGSEQHPGLMLSLDRGGQCKGVLYRLPPGAIETNLGRLFRREIRVKPSAHNPRWVNVRTNEAQLRALTFVINRRSSRYVSGLSADEIADALAVAVGPLGSMAEYLYSTVSHLEEHGIHDGYLWHLQELVAERLTASFAASGPLSVT